MSRGYRGDLKWRPGPIVKKAGPLMCEFKVGQGIIWLRHIGQLRPTASEPTNVRGIAPDTVEVSEEEVVSLPQVAVQ